MLVEQLLDFSREIFLAPAVDDFFLASGDAYVAFAIGELPPNVVVDQITTFLVRGLDLE